MLKLLLWMRYIRKKKIVLLSVAAVALSVALLMVVDSVFTGFVEGLEKANTWGTGDLIFQARFVPEYDILVDKIEEVAGVERVSPTLGGGGLLRLGSGDVREVVIEGIDAGRASGWRDLRESLLLQGQSEGALSFDMAGHPNDMGGWVGIGIVAEPDEKTDEYDLKEVRKLVGKRVVLMTSGWVGDRPEDVNGVGGQEIEHRRRRRTVQFRISDVFYSGAYRRDSTVYLPYDVYYELVFGGVSGFSPAFVSIWVREGADPAAVKDAILGTWRQFASEELGLDENAVSSVEVMTRGESLDWLYASLAELRKQMGVLLLMFGVICSISVLLIFCIFYVIVQTRQRDIAIMKSCGTGSVSVLLIFLGFGACIGIVGSLLGTVLGVIVIKNINAIERWVKVVFGLKVWRSSVYMLEKIPNEVYWGCVWWIVVAAVAACVFGALAPAIVATRVKPAKILRYE
ncbi:MAG: ABC transporter permease [Planctomycetota bacterium]|jgi:ABC-type lipoprotein release transport system permease subunit